MSSKSWSSSVVLLLVSIIGSLAADLTPTAANGTTYMIRAALNNKTLQADDVKDKLLSTRFQTTDGYSQFSIVKIGGTDDAVRIRVLADNQMLHADDARKGTNVVSTKYQPDDDYNHFFVVDRKDGKCNIKNKKSGRYMYVKSDTQIVYTQTNKDDPAAIFTLEKTHPTPPAPPTPPPPPPPPTPATNSWPHLCDAKTIPNTRCPADATCCRNKYSQSHMGCCPWANAVCCGNGLTCCPQGTKCVDNTPQGWPSWGVTTSCEPVSNDFTDPVEGKCVCKMGPPLAASPTLKNVLIIGDSVSIGYTPVVTDIMKGYALVQHAPWGGDGGAEETAYGLQCIDYFLRSPNGTSFKADLVYFNWGLHDGPQLFDLPPPNVTIPGQEGNMTAYAPQLTAITQKLKAYAAKTGAKLLFGITSPMMAQVQPDQDVVELNRRAVQVMATAGVDTVDLHAAVVAKCGPVPQKKCFGLNNCFSPHCGAVGYSWLANSTVVPAMRKALGM